MPERRRSAWVAEAGRRSPRNDDTVSEQPLTVAELAVALDAIGGIETRPHIAVAVSGGSDSLALVLLAECWARQNGGQVWALTVDHGLRPESGEEARTVAGWLEARGIPCEILVWAGDKPTSGIQEAARDMRYPLLEHWCRSHGVLHLLTAHHREDQVETHLIRRRAGSGVDGLAGMSAVRELAGCRLVRPLLSVPRTRLLAFLAEQGQPFLHDPSNLNPAYERARLRLADQGLARTDGVAAAMRACSQSRIARERDLDRLLARAVALHPAGFAVLDQARLTTANPESAERLLGRVVACVGGARYPARRERLARLRSALVARPDCARTLGGCLFVLWRGRFLVLRELAAASAAIHLEPGARVAWDRRFAAELAATARSDFTLGYLGPSGGLRPEQAACCLPRLLYPILPALWDKEGLAAVPHVGYRRAGAATMAQLFFRPANPLTRAGFTVV